MSDSAGSGVTLKTMNYWDKFETSYDKDILRPISLNLNNNNLIYQQGNAWSLIKSNESILSDENSKLKSQLQAITNMNEKLMQDLDETTRTKDIVIDMVINLIQMFSYLF